VRCGLGDIALNFLLVPRFGMIGAPVAGSLTCVGQNLLTLAAVKRTLSMSPYDRRYLTGIIAVLLTACAMAVTVPFLGEWRIKLLGAALGSLCLFPGLLIIFGLSAEDQTIVHVLRTRLAAALRR
jgi:O-antigen/teichoic acid export membrane protein